VTIIDPGIGIAEDELPFIKGQEMDVFLRSPITGKKLVAKVWPGHSVFPDWSHPNTTEYWELMLDEFRKKAPFDGLWVDMNEPTSFCDGECDDFCDDFDIPNKKFISEKIDLIYNPGNRPPSTNTIHLETRHYDGSSEFSRHNLFGYYNSKATYQYLLKRNHSLPFVLSRATFPGSGKVSSHWTGDNESSFPSMMLSIVGLLNFNV
jgi:alpha-glucosidase